MNRELLLGIVVLLVALSGCEAGTASVDIQGTINENDSGFVLDGRISNSGYSQPTFNDVTVYLYDSNGAVIASKEAGTMDPSANITMRTEEFPKYVIVNSPEFWEYGDISVSYYEYVEHVHAPNGTYRQHTIGSKEEFPVKVPPDDTT